LLAVAAAPPRGPGSARAVRVRREVQGVRPQTRRAVPKPHGHRRPTRRVPSRGARRHDPPEPPRRAGVQRRRRREGRRSAEWHLDFELGRPPALAGRGSVRDRREGGRGRRPTIGPGAGTGGPEVRLEGTWPLMKKMYADKIREGFTQSAGGT